MAHNYLPPKIPTPPNWPADFANHDHNIISSLHSSWANADGFLGFSSARRGLHRRSVSDSIAFLETPTMMMMSSRQGLLLSNDDAFDDRDEEQFRSMLLSDEIPPNDNQDDQATSSDHNSNEKLDAAEENDDEKLKEAEVQSECSNVATNISHDRITDPKRVKRILANRQSAQRSRVRKLQYITELERSVTTLQGEVSMLSPRVAFVDQQRRLLNVDNTALKQRIAILSQNNIFKDAHEEALKREVERLGELYEQQQKNDGRIIMESNYEQPTSPGDQKHKLLYV